MGLENLNVQEKMRILTDVFGEVTLAEVCSAAVVGRQNVGSVFCRSIAAVPAIARYGEAAILMEVSGQSKDEAVNNLFAQLVASAGRKNEDEKDRSDRPRVFRSSDGKEVVVYTDAGPSGNKGFAIICR